VRCGASSVVEAVGAPARLAEESESAAEGVMGARGEFSEIATPVRREEGSRGLVSKPYE